MPHTLSAGLDLIRRVYFLARPYGRKRLAIVFGFALAQGIFQVIGVTSIFPFLALAADPDRFRSSGMFVRIFEQLPPMGEGQLLLLAGLFALVMLFLSSGINLVAEFNRARYACYFGHWLRAGLLQKIASRPYGDFLQQNTSILLKKVLYDVFAYTNNVLLPLLDSFARLVTVLMLLVTLLILDPLVSMGTVFLFGLFYLAVFRLLGQRRREISDGVKLANRGLIRESQQFLGGIKTIKTHRTEEPFLSRIRHHSHEQARLTAYLPLFVSGPRYLIEPLAFGGVVILVLYYATRGQNFSALLPSLGVIALAGYRLLPSIQMLYGRITSLSTTRHALDEVYEEFEAVEDELDPEITASQKAFSAPPPWDWQSAIVLDDLTFQYPKSSKPVINRLSFVFPKNTSVGIVGTTGSGKSTLVDLILGLHQPTSGRILIDGRPLDKRNRRAWRGGIGYVPQDIFLIDDSIAANIAFGIPKEKVDKARLEEAAEAAQILSFIEDLPEQWTSQVGERGVRLSGGQRQRIGLARALYLRPTLLILDEATSSLDLDTEAEVMKAIDKLHGSITLLIVAHRLSTIRDCDTIIDLSRPDLIPQSSSYPPVPGH